MLRQARSGWIDAMGNIGAGIGEALIFLFVMVCICLPLAAWKVVDIVLWIVSHVTIN